MQNLQIYQIMPNIHNFSLFLITKWLPAISVFSYLFFPLILLIENRKSRVQRGNFFLFVRNHVSYLKDKIVHNLLNSQL